MSEAKKVLLRPDNRAIWRWAMAAGLAVLAAQWWLVARAGTDVPFQDQWDVEGKWLYPAWRDGALRLADLFQPYNGQRLVCTHLLNLCLFVLNGQWDPLLQMAVGAFLHAVGAMFLTRKLAALGAGWKARGAITAGVVLACLPLASWFNALNGFQSLVYFTLGFSLISFARLGDVNASAIKLLAGTVAGLAAMLSSGAGELVPVALVGLMILRIAEARGGKNILCTAWPAAVLLVAAIALMASVPPDHNLHALQSHSAGEFLAACARLMAWPHVDQPLAALALNLPLVLVVAARILRRRQPRAGEDFVLLLGGWAVAIALATAWARGGGGELLAGFIPSRYVDFIVLLPLANAWCAIVLAAEATGQWRTRARVLAAVWGCFLFIGWLGISLEMWRGIVRPRIHDRLAPVRLAVAFQASGDATVFAGQPRLYVPYPNPESILVVLRDPRLQGALPPSFQPKQPLGPLSRAVRALMDQ
ncbi:MAG TPA: hypothetical protein VNV15_02470 [Opitutaceae bacterium]|jgi:hypothetical protein|nr:hypothetical protein [Opitutaceae bacterium]